MGNIVSCKHFFAGNGATTLSMPYLQFEFQNMPSILTRLLSFGDLSKVKTSKKLRLYGYPHNTYTQAPYDGFLVSKAYLGNTLACHKNNVRVVKHFLKKALRQGVIRAKDERTVWSLFKQYKQHTMHNILLAPDKFPIMGDCGAFSFITAKNPPFSTSEVIDYYTTMKFTQGVSVDHLILDFVKDKQYRFDLTLSNAEDFIKEHTSRKLPWIPIASLQGWNVKSYTKAAIACAKMGYKYMAIGGIVKSSTEYIMRILESIRTELKRLGKDDVKLHLFGITRFLALPELSRLGATSFDSTSVYVASWMRHDSNYLTPEGWYPSIRLPATSKKIRHQEEQGVVDDTINLANLSVLSWDLINKVVKFTESGKKKVSSKLLDDIMTINYAAYPIEETAPKVLRNRIKRVLLDRTWEKCECTLCKVLGVRIMILFGKDLTAARAFHNLWQFHCNIYPRIMKGETFDFMSSHNEPVFMRPIFDLDPE